MHLAARFVLKALERFAVGHLTVQLPDGSTRVFGDPAAAPAGDLQLTADAGLRRGADCSGQRQGQRGGGPAAAV